jgi:hypothetical protein
VFKSDSFTKLTTSDCMYKMGSFTMTDRLEVPYESMHMKSRTKGDRHEVPYKSMHIMANPPSKRSVLGWNALGGRTRSYLHSLGPKSYKIIMAA